ncbi:MAG: ATP-binding cassette domain-containing protein [Mailhella sp.]|nr:ATP-binding cassette domain-containing protein [Mailhella sp.]
MALISVRDVALTVGNIPILNGADLYVEQGDRLCVVGRNGTGKSSLLSVLAGLIPLDGGVRFAAPGLRIGFLPQEVPQHWQGTVYDIVSGGNAPVPSDHDGYAGGRRDSTVPVKRRGAVGGDAAEEWERHGSVITVINGLGLESEAIFSSLSGGTRRRVALARALVDTDLLLLDEPTNHLDIETIAWLEDYLARSDKTIVFVSHDRAFVRKVATRITELDRTKLYSYFCGYDEYLRRRDERLHAEEAENNRFDKKLAQEEIWIRQGIKARRTRNMGRVRDLIAMRRERAARIEQQGTAFLAVQDAERSGELVAEMVHAGFTWPDGYAVFRDATLRIMRGDKIGLIGRNGAGKTTFLKVLLGEIAPTVGTVRLGTNLQIAYFDQLRDSLDDAKSVMDNVGDGADRITYNGADVHVAGYLQNFLFSSDRLRTPAGLLSGGERNRLLLAKLFTRPANVLVLDEPTNDLDVETLELLEELIAGFKGTAVIVSHDREFLDRLVTSTIALEGDGLVREYVGGYTDWLRQKNLAKPAEKSRLPRQKTPSDKRRLTYKEQCELLELEREFAEIPAKLQALEVELSTLNEKLADPSLYASDPAEFARVSARIPENETEQLVMIERYEEAETRIAELRGFA